MVSEMLVKHLVVILMSVTGSQGHNWLNMPSRAPQVSTARPCFPRRSLQQTHLQANPGDSFQVEWATGHPGSTGYFILVHAEHEDRLGGLDTALAEYMAQAPYKEFVDNYQVTRFGMPDTTPEKYLARTVDRRYCKEAKDGTKMFGAQVDRKTAHDRPEMFRGGMKGYFSFNEALPESCRKSTYISYRNQRYPWVLATLSYEILAHHGSDGAISMFKVPPVPSGKYVLRWGWRGYTDCVDVNVLVSSKPVADMWGHSLPSELKMARTDHCRWSGDDSHQWLHCANEGEVCRLKQPQQVRFGAYDKFTTKSQSGNVLCSGEAIGPDPDPFVLVGKVCQVKRPKPLDQLCTLIPEGSSDISECSAKCLSTKESYQILESGVGRYCSGAGVELLEMANGIQTLAKCEERCTETPGCNFYSYPPSWCIKRGADGCKRLKGMCRLYSTCDNIGPTNGNKRSLGPHEWVTARAQRTQCHALNVVPLSYPADVPSGFSKPRIPDSCLAIAEQAGWKGSMCFLAVEGPQTDGGPAFETAPSDPEDPVFYSSCFKRSLSGGTAFDGNTCGEQCLLGQGEAIPDWRIGPRCLDCSKRNEIGCLADSEHPQWGAALGKACIDCDTEHAAVACATPPPTPPPTNP